MAIGKPREYITIEKIESKVSELDILAFYLDIKRLPCSMRSPLRIDHDRSFAIRLNKEGKLHFYDFALQKSWNVYTFFAEYFRLSYTDTLEKIYNEVIKGNSIDINNSSREGCFIKVSPPSSFDLKCKIRDWEAHDIEYWESYGISLEWLKYADVYPISHSIVIKDDNTYTFPADKHAYAYIERKEGNITLKIYQPLNKKGFKWRNKHDKSVISLWTKIPEKGENLCICSSLKDALCLWSNTNIPAIATQGEGYNMSQTAINNLKGRYKNIFILYDNDPPGIKDGIKLAEITGFTNIILPYPEAKDISDYYKILQNKELFKENILKLFKL